MKFFKSPIFLISVFVIVIIVVGYKLKQKTAEEQEGNIIKEVKVEFPYRTYDLYSVVPPDFSTGGIEMDQPISGSAVEIADRIVGLDEFGITEVRCDIYPKSVEAIAAMQPVIDLVHSA